MCCHRRRRGARGRRGQAHTGRVARRAALRPRRRRVTSDGQGAGQRGRAAPHASGRQAHGGRRLGSFNVPRHAAPGARRRCPGWRPAGGGGRRLLFLLYYRCGTSVVALATLA